MTIMWNRKPEEGIWVLGMDDHFEKLLYGGHYVPFGWSADGKFIYASSSDSGHTEILQIAVRDGKSRTLVNMPGPLWRYSGTVSPNGRKMVVGVAEKRSDVWIMENFDHPESPSKGPS
jgi:Tol biopolymer transport system component